MRLQDLYRLVIEKKPLPKKEEPKPTPFKTLKQVYTEGVLIMGQGKIGDKEFDFEGDVDDPKILDQIQSLVKGKASDQPKQQLTHDIKELTVQCGWKSTQVVDSVRAALMLSLHGEEQEGVNRLKKLKERKLTDLITETPGVFNLKEKLLGTPPQIPEELLDKMWEIQPPSKGLAVGRGEVAITFTTDAKKHGVGDFESGNDIVEMKTSQNARLIGLANKKPEEVLASFAVSGLKDTLENRIDSYIRRKMAILPRITDAKTKARKGEAIRKIAEILTDYIKVIEQEETTTEQIGEALKRVIQRIEQLGNCTSNPTFCSRQGQIYAEVADEIREVSDLINLQMDYDYKQQAASQSIMSNVINYLLRLGTEPDRDDRVKAALKALKLENSKEADSIVDGLSTQTIKTITTRSSHVKAAMFAYFVMQYKEVAEFTHLLVSSNTGLRAASFDKFTFEELYQKALDIPGLAVGIDIRPTLGGVTIGLKE